MAFTRIYNEQVKLHGRTREVVLKTIRICKDQNVLREYLSGREKEVVDIMMTLFNEEYILKTYVESEKLEAEKRGAEKTKIDNKGIIADGVPEMEEYMREVLPNLEEAEI